MTEKELRKAFQRASDDFTKSHDVIAIIEDALRHGAKSDGSLDMNTAVAATTAACFRINQDFMYEVLKSLMVDSSD